MTLRPLGNSGIQVAPLALGTNVFGWTVDERTAFQLLDAFVASGLNLLDTADIYSKWAPGNQGGESEAMIGNWLKRSGKRKSVIIATKVGMEMGPGKKGLSKSYIPPPPRTLSAVCRPTTSISINLTKTTRLRRLRKLWKRTGS